MIGDWKELYKREDNWKKYPYLYNEQKNMTFECECGKKYVSFPGLYLHFQRKHNQKISTKPEESECFITQNDGSINYKYFILMKQLIQEESLSLDQPQQLDILAKIMHEFYSGAQSDHNISPLIKPSTLKFSLYDHYIPKLENYVRQQAQKKMKKIDKQTIQNLPHYFNGFILSMREEGLLPIESQKGLCSLIMSFWEWLSAKKLTTLILEYNEHPSESINGQHSHSQ